MGLAGIRQQGSAWKISAAALIVCVAIEVNTLADRSLGEPRNDDIRRYVLGEIYDAYRIQQRFVVKADGLSSVTIHPRPAAPNPTGRVLVDLRDVTGDHERGRVAAEWVPALLFARSESYTLRFRPQPSGYREYLLEVTVQGGSDGQGIGLLATRGEGYRGGRLFINDGRQRYGDLVFETTVNGASSNFGSIAAQMAQSGIPAPAVVLFLVIVGKYVALALIIRAFAPWAGSEVPTAPLLPSLRT